uniref:Structural maintenance of chromosomes protein n=1 Tax=Parastrongyloides trichosuri TaxID=131310 RepID=A0A0N4ZSV1_PARTI
MRVKTMELDGFKSYARPVALNDFDASFNAITGLNGSGKSNILDAICFVLGITNLSHVRCSKMDDLVYKQGQAGVTKATVTLTFENSDKRTSPIGYEKDPIIRVTRSVVVNGKPSCSINGHTCTMAKVQDMFRSVGLNVNNPHFLIMQGRIAKVLNMKPKELLGMVEEAAGTTLYDVKKENALKQLSEKMSKLELVEEMFVKDIDPQVKKLKNDREKLYNHQKLEKKAKLASERLIAYEYLLNEKEAEKCKSDIIKEESGLRDLVKLIEETEKEKEDLSKEIEELKLIVSSGPSEEEIRLRDEAKRANDDLLVVQNNKGLLEDKLVQLKNDIENKEKQIKNDTEELLHNHKKLEDSRKNHGSDADRRMVLEKIIKDNREKISNIACGRVDNGEGEKVSLKALIGQLSAKESSAKTRLFKLNNENISQKRNIVELEKQLKTLGTERSKDEKDFERLTNEIKELEEKLNKIPFDKVEYNQLNETKEKLGHSIYRSKNEYEEAESRLHFGLHLNDPHNTVDQSKVYGPAGFLLDVKDQKFFGAIETAGGGNFRNIVVEDSRIATAILNTRPPNRVSFLPLKDMRPRVISDQAFREAYRIAGEGNVWRAIDLITFNPKYKPAMEHLFGSVLVCSNANVAKDLCFNPNIRHRCVTLDGDDYNPSGILTGGSSKQTTGSFLRNILSAKSLKETYDSKNCEFLEIKKKLLSFEKYHEEYKKIEADVNQKKLKLNELRYNIEGSRAHTTKVDYEKCSKRIIEIEEEIKSINQELEEIGNRLEEAKRNDMNSAEYAEKERALANKAIDEAKAELELQKQKYVDAETIITNIKNDIETLEQSIKADKEKIGEMNSEIEKLEVQIDELTEPLSNFLATRERKKRAFDEYIASKRDQEDELRSKDNKLIQLATDIENCKTDQRRKSHSLESLKDKYANCTKRIKDLEEKNSFILVSKEHFGLPGTNFDFSDVPDYTTLREESDNAQIELEESSKNVNKKCIQALANSEQQYEMLEEKRNSTKQDCVKLQKTIEELEIKKNQTLLKACEKVNIDFNKIFTMLLPGTEVKLVGVNDDVLKGLEVKIAFNNVWKESLSDLSGGQRSLIALSLILAMLKFNPAPLYILDEIDAALDLSHTQNIGRMIKSEFTESQFIIVSLKDGMFSNANILYKTKFVDGSSTVTRLEPDGRAN